MGQANRAQSALLSVGIISPFEIWSAGVCAKLPRLEVALAGCWTSLGEASESDDFYDCDLLMVSNRMFERPQAAMSFRPLDPMFAGKLIAVVEVNEDFSADEFIALDVEGLILSTSRVETLLECVQQVAAGGKWVDPGIRNLLRKSNVEADRIDQLSHREKQVARLAAMGLSNKAIARELNVSDGTVKMHMHHVLSKLKICSRVQLTL